MKKTMKKLLSMTLTAAVVASLAGCGGTTSSESSSAAGGAAASETSKEAGAESSGENVVKVGVIYPTSGNVAKIGQESLEAIKLAADIINNKYDDLNVPFAADEGLPGLGGAKIELVISDSQGSPEVGLSEAERLITEEGVDVLLGAYHSSVTKTASNVAEKYGIPFINPDSTSVTLTDRGYEWFFRTTPNDSTFVADTLKFLQDVRDNQGKDIKTVSMIHEDSEWGSMLRQQFEEQIGDYGFDVLEDISYSSSATDLSAEVMKLKAANADVLLCGSYTADTILLFKTMKEQGWAPKLMVGQRSGFTAPETVKTIGVENVEGIISTNLYAEDLGESNPTIGTVNSMFKDITGENLTDAYSRSFVGLCVIAEAVNAAGSTDPEKVRDALVNMDITNEGQLIVPWDGIKFDENGQNIRCNSILTQMHDGIFYTVYPEKEAAKELAYPFSAWGSNK